MPPFVSTHQLSGDWHLRVIQKVAAFEQRFRIAGSAGSDGIYSGNVGSTVTVRGNGQTPWTIEIEHNDGAHGWEPSEVRVRSDTQTGSQIKVVIESEDRPIDGDRDFTDCVIEADVLSMIDSPSRGNALWPNTMQLMPEGIFEKTFGRYFLAVRVHNVWTRPWPVGATVGLTESTRLALSNRGIAVSDTWAPEDAAAVGQEITMSNARARAVVGQLAPWESVTVYFKVDLVNVVPNIHTQGIQLNVLEPGAPDPAHARRRTSTKMWISDTTFDPVRNVFTAKTDIGQLSAAVRELTVDYRSLKRAVGRARELFGTSDDLSRAPRLGRGRAELGCDQHEIDKLRRDLLAFLAGETVDLCDIWRRLQCCCAGGGFGVDPGDEVPWSKTPPTGLEIIGFPNVVDYSVDYNDAFGGEHGPLPYEDPWWKVVLAIIAIILSLAAAASAAADLANRSNDTVIGQLTRAVLDPTQVQPDPSTFDATDPGSVDAAVVTLNGSRGLTASVFSYLDAQSNEGNTDAVEALDGRIDTDGTIVTNAEINQIFQDIADNPGDPTFLAALNIFKSGARTGTTKATLVQGVQPFSRRRRNDGGTDFFINQLNIMARGGAEVSNSGDSGSLWLQEDASGNHRIVALNHAGCTNLDATACRVEDVVNKLNVRFA